MLSFKEVILLKFGIAVYRGGCPSMSFKAYCEHGVVETGFVLAPSKT